MRQFRAGHHKIMEETLARLAEGGAESFPLAGDVVGPAAANRVEALSGSPATLLVNQKTGVTIKQTEGGTLAAPTPETQLFVQPRDPAKAGFALRLDFGVFNGIVDNVWEWGYNPAGTDPVHGATEPQAWVQIEQDFQPVALGPHFTEFHVNMFNPGQTNGCRPFFAGCDRVSGSVTTEIGYAFPLGSPGGGAGIVLFSQSGPVSNSMVEFIDTSGAGACEQAFNVSGFLNSVGFLVMRSQTSSVFLDAASTIWRSATGASTFATLTSTGLVFNTGTADVGYTPGVPGNWAGAAPTTVQQALDRLAAAVRGLLGAPIP